MLLSSCCQYLRLLVCTSVQISDSDIRFGYLILNFDIHDIPKIHLMLHCKSFQMPWSSASTFALLTCIVTANDEHFPRFQWSVTSIFLSRATIFSSVQNPIYSIVSQWFSLVYHHSPCFVCFCVHRVLCVCVCTLMKYICNNGLKCETDIISGEGAICSSL